MMNGTMLHHIQGSWDVRISIGISEQSQRCRLVFRSSYADVSDPGRTGMAEVAQAQIARLTVPQPIFVGQKSAHKSEPTSGRRGKRSRRRTLVMRYFQLHGTHFAISSNPSLKCRTQFPPRLYESSVPSTVTTVRCVTNARRCVSIAVALPGSWA